MKKLLTLISAIGMGATGLTGALNVASCSKKDSKDAGVTNVELKANNEITVSIKKDSETAKLFTVAKDADLTFTFKVQAAAKVALKDGGDTTTKALADVLSGDGIKDFVEGIKSNDVKNLVVKSLTAYNSAVKADDITAYVEVGSIMGDKDLGNLDVEDGVYGLETVDWNTGLDKDTKDRNKDINDIKQELLNRLNNNIKEGSKALTLTNTKITFKEPATGKFVPSSATIEMVAAKGTDISGIGGSVDVKFIIEQNIDPNGFILADKDGTETHYPGVNIVNQKPGSATIEIQKGAGDNDKIYLADIHIPDFSTWKYGDDYSDQFYNKEKPEDTSENESGILVGTGDGDKFIKIISAGAKVGATNKITFHVLSGGFKKFELTISMIAQK